MTLSLRYYLHARRFFAFISPGAFRCTLLQSAEAVTPSRWGLQRGLNRRIIELALRDPTLAGVRNGVSRSLLSEGRQDGYRGMKSCYGKKADESAAIVLVCTWC